jgi:hypothetical protein
MMMAVGNAHDEKLFDISSSVFPVLLFFTTGEVWDRLRGFTTTRNRLQVWRLVFEQVNRKEYVNMVENFQVDGK